MTTAQDRTISRIRRDAERMHSCAGYEIKQFDVRETDHGTVSVYVSVGLIGDEGTVAEVIGRDTALIFIGPRGGTRIPKIRKSKSGKFVTHYTQYRDMWQASIDYSRY